jgi:hypothetical protein
VDEQRVVITIEGLQLIQRGDVFWQSLDGAWTFMAFEEGWALCGPDGECTRHRSLRAAVRCRQQPVAQHVDRTRCCLPAE